VVILIEERRNIEDCFNCVQTKKKQKKQQKVAMRKCCLTLL